MNRIVRLISLSILLLLVFLAVAVVSQYRLKRHAERLAREVTAARQQQFEHVLALAKLGTPPWSEATLSSLGKAIDAEVTAVYPAMSGESTARATDQTAPSSPAWRLEHPIFDSSGVLIAIVKVQLRTPAILGLVSIYRQTTVILLLLALGLLLLLGALIVLGLRDPRTTLSPTTATARAEMDSLTHLAKISVQQGTELTQERNERMRAEEDLHFKQVLLNRALEEKIQLGRDLHDGIIQSLYATGLTLEAAKNSLNTEPTDAARKLEAGLATLNATIRDVRSYIAGLGPDNLRQQTFAESVHSLTQTIDAGRNAGYDLKIDDSAAARLGEDHFTDLLQIVREAVSNSLRHGGAKQITVRLHENNGELCLLVQDDGKGFINNSSESADSHGLNNMTARAQRLGGNLRISSSPGEGTRIVFHLPLTAVSTS